MGALTVTMSITESQVLVRVAGEADLTVSDQLCELLAAVLAGAQQLVVDVSGLRFIDVACVRVLVQASGSAEDAGAPLVLAAPQPIVARMLELCRADQLITGSRSVPEAAPRRVPPATGAPGPTLYSDHQCPASIG
jgi:anti-anti-sigma factor